MSILRSGDLLVNHKIITAEQLGEALQIQRVSGGRLSKILIEKGYLNEKTLLNFLTNQLNIPFVDLTTFAFDMKVVKKIPEAYARKFGAILLREDNNSYQAGMQDPLDIIAIDELNHLLDKPITLAIVSEKDLGKTLDTVYRRTEEIMRYAGELDDEFMGSATSLLEEHSGDINAPVVKFLRSIFEDAAQVHASDIHIEPDEKVLRIRLRVDGALHEQVLNEKKIFSAVSSRLKLMANLNIAEKRLPQDGRFSIKIRGSVFDVRLSTLPTVYGESIVMRLLSQSTAMLELDRIGMPEEILTRLRQLVRLPHGIILVTGPTGSGKTTTLYGLLNELNDENTKIITAEDPVEYRLPRIMQVQVEEKLHLDFLQVLRAAMRQDPDVILVGEMRDEQTASVAIRAALTGHIVLSTLHTNDSPSTALRLMDMGIKGFLVAATVRGIVAQRLLRKVCDGCITKHTLNEVEKNWLIAVGYAELVNYDFASGKGCNNCNQSGYHGRKGVYELLEINADMMVALREQNVDKFITAANIVLKGKFLIDNAIAMAKLHITSISEVMQVTGER